MFDARLEINIYRLLAELKRSPGPWIGAPIKLSEQAVEIDADGEWPSDDSAFERYALTERPEFLSIREGTFLERTRAGEVISEVSFEYVAPQQLSFSTVTVLPVVKSSGGVFVGLESRDLPAVQTFTGSSRIVTVPSWRLPRSLRSVRELSVFVSDAMKRDFGLEARNVWELGGSYFSSPGVTPEVVFPFVIEVDADSVASSSLRFIDGNDLTARLDQIHDAHLLLAARRLHHALGAELSSQ
jgi:hypothetical protein